MRTKETTNKRLGMALVAIILLVAIAVIPVMAIEISPKNGVNLTVINKQRPSLYDSQNPGTYFFNIGNGLPNGGQNAVHITNSNSSPSGQVNTGASPDGYFYISDTGGKGYEDEAILLIAVSSDVDPDFSIHIKSEGYKFADHAPTSPPTVDQVGTFNSNAYEGTLDSTNFLTFGQYSELVSQNFKMGTDGSPGDVNHLLFNGENLGTEGPYNIILVDLNTSVVGNNVYNATYRDSLIYNGNPKISYSITGLGDTGRVAFAPYTWVNYTTGGGSYFDRTIGWTNRVSDGGSWIVNATPLS